MSQATIKAFFRAAILLFAFLVNALLSYGQQVSANRLEAFIPKGFAILDTAMGDLNQDGYPDVVMALSNILEEDSMDLPRPLLILIGDKGGLYLLKGRNDHVVLCKGCGGVWGNPFEGLVVKGRYFSVEHYGGSRFRWSQVVTFRFEAALNDFVLHKDAGSSYDNTQPDKVKNVVYSKKGPRKVLFRNYRNTLLN